MARQSAGLLIYRIRGDQVEVLLVHPGGPFWQKKDLGSWSIPKGEHDAADRDGLTAALREFREETGLAAPATPWADLGEVRLRGGKVVHAWAGQADPDVSRIRSNTFTMEWPRGSGTLREFPEVDRAAWFDLATARAKLLPAQAAFIDRLSRLLETAREGGAA